MIQNIQSPWIIFTIIFPVWDYAKSSVCDLPISNAGESACPTTTVWSYYKQLDECIYEEIGVCGDLSGNQFSHKIDCEDECVGGEKPTKSICNLPISNAVGGGCPTITVWSYVKDLNKCIYEDFGGCYKFSGNQFGTRIHCEEDCVRGKEITNNETRSICYLERPYKVQDSCNYKSVYSYDPESDSCYTWETAKCQLEGNAFRSYHQCRYQCVLAPSTTSFPTSHLCDDDQRSGGGRCKKRLVWKFNKLNSTCTSILSRACIFQGNAFFEMNDCISECQAKNFTEPLVYEKRLGVCNIAISNTIVTRCDEGIRVFSYNSQLDSCIEWVYYGCEISGNKFLEYDDCVKKCLATEVSATDGVDPMA